MTMSAASTRIQLTGQRRLECVRVALEGGDERSRLAACAFELLDRGNGIAQRCARFQVE